MYSQQYFDKEPEQLPNLNNIISIVAGYDYSLFLKSDGTVYGLGNNENGVLGLDENIVYENPVQIPNLDNVISISSKFIHSLFLKSDGTVYGCGVSENGNLGKIKNDILIQNNDDDMSDEDEEKRYASLQQIPDLKNIIAISAGERKSIYLSNDNIVYGTGIFDYGMDLEFIHKKPAVLLNNQNIVSISDGPDLKFFITKDGKISNTILS